MNLHVGKLVVVEPGALELAVIHGEAERLDQVQARAGVRREADHVAGVRRDLGMDEDDVEHQCGVWNISCWKRAGDDPVHHARGAGLLQDLKPFRRALRRWSSRRRPRPRFRRRARACSGRRRARCGGARRRAGPSAAACRGCARKARGRASPAPRGARSPRRGCSRARAAGPPRAGTGITQSISWLGDACGPSIAAEQRRERELAAELERVHQRVGGEFVGERGDGGVVVRRLAQAAAAELAARRLERAARAALARKARQVGVAGRAQQRRAAAPRQR